MSKIQSITLPLLCTTLLAACGDVDSGRSADLPANEPELQALYEQFLTPPSSAKPGVYWYFMDGNQTRDAMTADLESMAEVGLNSVIFLEVNIGVPRGPVDFMSEEWQGWASPGPLRGKCLLGMLCYR